MMNKSIALSMMALWVCGATCASAAAPSGGQPDDFLRYGVGARGLAMGGAFGAIADDATASHYNPAGLANLSAYEIHVMHAPLFESTSLDYIGTALPLTPYLVFGLSGVLVRSTGFEQRTEDNIVVGANGVISHSAYLITAATRYDTFALGATTKMLTQSVLGRTGHSFAVDVGALVPVTPWMKMGLDIQNVNQPKVQLIDEHDSYPIRYNVGASFMFPGNLFLLGVEYHSAAQGVVAGGELALAKSIKLRAGLDDQTLPTLGLGITHGHFTFDYGLANHTEGALHRFSMSARFGNLFRLKVVPEYGRSESMGILPENANDQVRFRVQSPKFPVEWWKMTISGPDGSPLVKFNRQGVPNTTITWDFKDAFGRPVREGTYPYEFQVKYRRGDVWAETGSVKVLQSTILEGEPIHMQMKNQP